MGGRHDKATNSSLEIGDTENKRNSPRAPHLRVGKVQRLSVPMYLDASEDRRPKECPAAPPKHFATARCLVLCGDQRYQIARPWKDYWLRWNSLSPMVCHWCLIITD